jgi:cytochrome c oxidase cbb3-type subunit 3
MEMRFGVISLIIFAFFSSSGYAAPDGKQLYAQQCESCHGQKGSGGVGVPLALPAFLDSVSNEYLEKTIRYGRPGRVMPAFTDLSSAQVASLVKYIRSWSKQKAPEETVARIKGDVQNGKKLFAKHCAACHGANGEGGKGTGVTFSRPRDLPIIAPALHNSGFLAAVNDGMIKNTLMKGRAGTPMISFLKQGLKEKDINDLVAYVRSFEKTALVKPVGNDEDEKVFRYESTSSFEDTVKSVKKAIVGANFRLIRTQFFEQGYVPKGKENQKKLIIYFCNFNMLNEALAIDPRAGLFLPCRVTIVENNGKVEVIAINPSILSKSFNNNELDKICNRMSNMYRDILEEATL